MIQVHRDLAHLPQFTNAVITIGTFDGVHLGHQQILKLLKEEAAATGGETVIITFHPHPRKVLAQGKSDVKVINTLEEKIELLNEKGIAHLAVTAFTDEFSNQSAEEYIENFLVKKFNPHAIVIGYDHKFGKNRTGDYHLLEKMSDKFQYKVKEIPEHVLNEIKISSTKIREALLNNDIDTANKSLGYYYFFEGKVAAGNKLGRTIGYPTANLIIENDEKLIPGNGVYAVQLTIGENNAFLKGMMNIGFRPTINGNTRTIEVNIFDFDENIYDQLMRVYVCKFLRGEVKFGGLDRLKEQLANDKVNALQELEKSQLKHSFAGWHH